MSDSKTSQIETMLSDLIRSVGTLKSYFEEEKEENQKRFEQVDRRFEQMDKRFDEVLSELRTNKREHNYIASRLLPHRDGIRTVKRVDGHNVIHNDRP